MATRKRKNEFAESSEKIVEDEALADTDTEMDDEEDAPAPVSSIPPLFRMSSRVASLKRRGKFQEPKPVEEFDFYAEDILTVRATGDQQFYVCRVLEDVSTESDQITIAWYDLVAPNRYEVSYDDTIYKATVITQVELVSDENNAEQFLLPNKFLKETKKLLKDAMKGEGIDVEESDECNTDEGDEEDDEPSAKQRKKSAAPKRTPKKKGKSSTSNTPKQLKSAGTKRKKETPVKTPKRGKGLIPNPEIELLECDPTFSKGSRVPLMTVKEGLRAVMNDDKKELKRLIADVKNVYSVNWIRSPHVQKGPYNYAILQENMPLLKLLKTEDKREEVTASHPKTDLKKKDNGSYNFYTFGHAVRDITVSRGNKEGNNAFLMDEGGAENCKETYLDFALKRNLSYAFIKSYFLDDKNEDEELEIGDIIRRFDVVVQRGHYQLAGQIATKAVENSGFGFNFLHKEVLTFTTEPLTAFRAPSVTKKAVNGMPSPLHCACINPNVEYLKQLLQVSPLYNFSDLKDNRPIHYAAACVGDGPLKYLLSRGVDPSSVNRVQVTPLMIAAKCNRAHNIDVLMSCTVQDNDDDDGDDATIDGSDAEDESSKKEKLQVNIDAKDRSSLAALHYAAKRGNVEAVAALLKHNANIDIKTAAGSENMTPLGYAAAKGHYGVVKLLIEKGANPEFKMRRNKTALIYACMNGHSQIVAYLLNIGVNPDARDSSDNTPLHYAAAYGWFYCVKLLLEGGANPSVTNNWKTSPFLLSVMMHHSEIGELLLSADIDVNDPDEKGCTVLMKTIDQGFDVDDDGDSRDNSNDEQTELIKQLVQKHRADVNQKDVRGWNCLHYLASKSVYKYHEEGEEDYDNEDDEWSEDEDEDAEENDDEDEDDENMMKRKEKREKTGKSNKVKDDFKVKSSFSSKLSEACLKIADVLLKGNVDVNASSCTGETPLMIAARQFNFALIRLLLQNGASAACGDSKVNSENALHVLLKNNRKEKVSLLELFPDKKNMKLSAESCEKLFHRATKETISTILKNEPNILNLSRQPDETPFMLAALHYDLEICKLLVKHDDTTWLKKGQNKYGENILHILAGNCHVKEAVEILNVVLREKRQLTVDVVNRYDNTGLTPLLRAADNLSNHKEESENKERENVKNFMKVLLTKCKVDVTISVGEKKPGRKIPKRPTSQFIIDEENEDKELLKKHEKYGGLGLMNIVHFLIRVKDTSVLKMVLNGGASVRNIVNRRDRYGRTPLQHTIRTGWSCSKEQIECLLELGLDVNMKSENSTDSYAPTLVLAARYEQPFDALLTLIQHADNVNATCDKQLNVGHLISSSNYFHLRKVDLMKALLSKGYHINSTCEQGMTALHFAVRKATGNYNGTISYEKFLIAKGAKKNIADQDGRYPLYHAFFNKGDDETKDSVSSCDPMTIVKLLCEMNKSELNGGESFGDYINHRDKNNATALHHGCKKGATISCMQLMKLKADHTIIDHDGNTALAIAFREGHQSCALTMLQEEASPVCDVITPVSSNQKEKYEEECKKFEWNHQHIVVKPERIIQSPLSIAINKGWSGLAHMILDVSKLPLLYAFRDGAKCGELAFLWILLSDVEDKTILLQKDAHERTLLHFLAEISTECSEPTKYIQDYSKYYDDSKDKLKKEFDVVIGDDTMQLANVLINAGVQLKDRDTFGMTALHVATRHNNNMLAAHLAAIAPTLVNEKDLNGRSALVDAFNDSEEKVKLFKYLVSRGGELDLSYTKEDGSPSTLLIDAVHMKNKGDFSDNNDKRPIGCLEYLLQQGASVDFPASNGDTPLMVAICANDEETVKLLMKYQHRMDIQNADGNSYVHACVKSRDYGSFENVNLLKLLVKQGAPINLKNNNNNTPRDLAQQQRSNVMETQLKKLKAKYNDNNSMEIDSTQEFGFEFRDTNTILPESPYDYIKDSQEEVRLRIGDVVLGRHDNKAKVDEALFSQLDNGVSEYDDDDDDNDDDEDDDDDDEDDKEEENDKDDEDATQKNIFVYCDPVNNKPYDVTLSKIDTKWGFWGLNLFYKLQVVFHNGRNLWILFNRWGRIGVKSQYQQTPFFTAEEATAEFRKIFKSKTGNEWCNVTSFEKKPKKYNLVSNEKNPENMVKYQKKILQPFDEDNLPKSQLDPAITDLMKSIANSKDITSANKYVDREKMPLGLISCENIGKANSLLEEMRALIQERQQGEKFNITDADYEKLADLSNEYYMLIPPSGYTFNQIKPMNNLEVVETAQEQLAIVTDLSYSYKVLIGALHRQKEMNPYDYCYSAMNCRIETLVPRCDEAHLITNYMTSCDEEIPDGYRISGMFRVKRDQDGFRNDLENKHLLWHGTDVAHVMSILRDGLRISPNSSIRSGSKFGKGIYFSWTFPTSFSFTQSRVCKSKYSYVMLCEVALGRIYHCHEKAIYDKSITFPPKNSDSVWIKCKEIADPKQNVTMPYGPVVLVGDAVENPKLSKKEKENTWHNYQEVVVYNAEQVRVRYIVQLEQLD